MVECCVNIAAGTGFARAAVKLSETARLYTADLFVEYEGKTIRINGCAESIMDVMALPIKPAGCIHVRADGIDEQKALRAAKMHMKE